MYSKDIYANGQQIDCHADQSNIRIRATYFSEEGEAILRDSRLIHSNSRVDLQGLLTINYSEDQPYYETIHEPYTIRFFPNRSFDLLYGKQLVDSGKCEMNTVGPF